MIKASRGQGELPAALRATGALGVGLLAALFATPLLLTLLDAARLQLAEQRAVSGPLPLVRATITGVKRQLTEAPPGLGQLKRVYDELRIRRLRSSPNPKVVIGAERDWLYFLPPDEGLPTYTRDRPFTAAEAAHWQRFVRQRVAWFGARGITYLMVMTPSKSSIVPEHVPQRIARRAGPGRFDQLLSDLSPEVRAHVLDLRPVLRAQARRERNYFRLDTHWNDVGAYRGYQALIARLQQLSQHAARPLPRSWATPVPVVRRVVDSPRHDLLSMLNWPHVLSERSVALTPRGPGPRRVALPPGSLTVLHDPALAPDSNFFPYALQWQRPMDLPNCVAFRDSFFHVLEPYMARHCQRLSLLKHLDKVGVPALLIDVPFLARERPDVVIEQYVERLLTRPHNAPPQLLGAAEDAAFSEFQITAR